MIVKICGLTTLADSLAAAEAGADMLGFNFYPPSPRYISPVECRRIADELKQRAARPVLVGVFVNASPEEINEIMQTCGLDLAQLCGDEPTGLLQALGERAFKALRPATQSELQESIQHYPLRKNPPAWLVDAHRAGSYGGSGRTANWELAAELAAQAPILLAGGLTTENIAAAVVQVRPWGVDVASGVESSPGRKDRRKMDEFILAARQVAKEIAR
jgi:phosphoribosylanthranilate isomerase